MRIPGLGVANKLQKTADKLEGGAAADEEAAKLRGRTALLISVLAAFLALASSGADTSNQNIINANIQASNLWAFYQAKNMRQTLNAIAADDLEAEIRLRKEMDPALKADLEKVIEKRRATAARYESEPDPADAENPLKGEGKKELMARAKDWERQGAASRAKAKGFGVSAVLLQIGVVLGSVAILANNKLSFVGMLVAGVLGAGFLVNAYLLIVPF